MNTGSQLIRFVGVGGVSTLLHVCVALAASALAELNPFWSNLAGYSAAVLFSYFGHTRLTFDIDAQHAFHFPRFLLVSLAGLGVSSGVTWITTALWGWPIGGAMVLVALSVPAASYLLLRFWALTEAREVDKTTGLGLVLSVASGLAYFLFMQGRLINHDTAWYFVATRKWLEGAELYRDIIEVNPPLNFYYTAPVIWLSDVAGLSETDAQYALLSALMAIVLFWSWRLLEQEPMGKKLWLFFGVLLALTIPALRHVGQREHVMAMFLMPYVVGLLQNEDGDRGWSGGLRGLFAAFGICLKHYFILFPLAVTALLMWERRSFRPIWSASNLSIVIAGSIYVSSVWLVHPTYLTEIVPMAFEVYDAYQFKLGAVVENSEPLAVVLVAMVIVQTIVRGPRKAHRASSLVLAAFAIYFWQFNGFTYQFLPFFTFAMPLVFWSATHRPNPLHAICIGILIGLPATNGTYHNERAATIITELREHGVFDGIMTLTPHPSLGPTLALQLDTEWASGYPALWTLPAVINAGLGEKCAAGVDRCAKLEAIRKDTLTRLYSDLQSSSPDIIVVDKSPGYIRYRNYDFLPLMHSNSDLNSLLEEYRPAAEIERFLILRRHLE